MHSDVLTKSRLKYDMRNFYITNRVVDQWNSLPNWVVTQPITLKGKSFPILVTERWARS